MAQLRTNAVTQEHELARLAAASPPTVELDQQSPDASPDGDGTAEIENDE